MGKIKDKYEKIDKWIRAKNFKKNMFVIILKKYKKKGFKNHTLYGYTLILNKKYNRKKT